MLEINFVFSYVGSSFFLRKDCILGSGVISSFWYCKAVGLPGFMTISADRDLKKKGKETKVE